MLELHDMTRRNVYVIFTATDYDMIETGWQEHFENKIEVVYRFRD
jgi:hypothetical protein